MSRLTDPTFILSVDVDWIPGSESGLSGIFDFCQRYRIPATHFFTGKFAERYPDLVKEAVARGDELGTHGWAHGQLGRDDEENFEAASYEDQRRWIEASTDAVERAGGVRPLGFRAPNLRVSETTFRVLHDLGYRFDSSVPARRFTVTYGAMNSPRYYWAPLGPYHPDPTALQRRGDSSILEVPPSAWFLPLNMSALRVFGAAAIRWTVRRLRTRTPVLVFFVHPSEFVVAEKQTLTGDNPRRHLEGIGPQNFATLGKFVDDVLALGYRAGSFRDLQA